MHLILPWHTTYSLYNLTLPIHIKNLPFTTTTTLPWCTNNLPYTTTNYPALQLTYHSLLLPYNDAPITYHALLLPYHELPITYHALIPYLPYHDTPITFHSLLLPYHDTPITKTLPRTTILPFKKHGTVLPWSTTYNLALLRKFELSLSYPVFLKYFSITGIRTLNPQVEHNILLKPSWQIFII